jgi:predicted ATPase/signal transduction histidine kinase/class 3 adenylate cyclase
MVEDSEDDAFLLAAEVESAGYALQWHRVQGADDLRAALGSAQWDVVISDDNLPGFSADGALAILKDTGVDVPFIIVSGAISEERAVAAMKAGAHDYVMKGNRLRLLPAIERELEEASQRRARREAELALAQQAADYLTQLERRVAERTAELERAQHAKEELLATVSHELRTPLASMLGALELLSTGTLADEQRAQLMDITLGEGQRLRALIENFLSLQRMEHGWHAVTPRPTDLSALLQRVAGETGSSGTHRVVVESDPSLPHAMAEADQIELVLTNLIGTARKYSPDGGTIRVGAAPTEATRRAPAVEVWVRDDGVGIPPEALPRLFERFYRVDAPSHRGVPGTGLGLSICRRIVLAHGGRIWAESDGPGHGATFRFTLPAVTAANEVTLLFTDIEGSTKLWERLPDWMRNALARHDAILRREIEAHGGHVFKTVGDAFCAAFRDPATAVEAALAVQRALRKEPWGSEWGVDGLRVRVALHTGPVQERDGDYFGPPLNRVARLLSIGHGGQVLVSLATADLVRDELPEDAALRDMGERRLKDLTRPERVFQLQAPDLPSAFPPLKSLDARRNNLPPQLTQLVGREREAEELRRRLLDPATRLVTLTGPGGTGKSRLSLQVAADSIDDFDHGTFFVPLAEIDDPELVPAAIAAALDVREEATRSVRETLLAALRDQQLLVVLDNLEQVVDCAPFVGELLRACPSVKLLATSRIPLRVYGEREYPLAPLPEDDAVRLFVERARDARPDFETTGAAAAAVAQICARSDGLPLAIELAAARVREMTPEAMLARKDRRQPNQSDGARDLPARQQTLHNLIQWSYDLLDAGEKALFCRLGVFRGAFGLDAAETVAAAPGVASGLASLAEKSLVRRVGEPGAQSPEPRFELLQTIHEFALEQLEASGDAAAVRDRHAGHFAALAEAAQPNLGGAEQVAWLNRLEADHDDLRAALRWLEEQSQVDLERALRLGAALWGFWLRRGHFHEGRAQLERLLQLVPADAAPSPAWASAYAGAGTLAAEQGDYDVARERFFKALELWQALGDRRRVAGTLLNLGTLARRQADYFAAKEFLERSLDLWSEVGSPQGTATALTNLGVLALDQGDPAAARPYLERSLAIKRELGDTRGTATALINLAEVALDLGDLPESRRAAHEAIRLFQEAGARRGLVDALEACACLAAAEGDPMRGGALAGAAAALREEIGAPAPAVQRARLERWLGAVPAPEAPTSLEEAIDLALAPPTGAPAGGAASTAYPV